METKDVLYYVVSGREVQYADEKILLRKTQICPWHALSIDRIRNWVLIQGVERRDFRNILIWFH